MTPRGIRTSEKEYEFDVIIYATGFDAFTGSFDRIDFRVVGGRSLKDKWRDGPRTFLGIFVDGFPNLMMILGPHSNIGNYPRTIEFDVEWVSELIEHGRETGATLIEPTSEGRVVGEGGRRIERGPVEREGRLLADRCEPQRRRKAEAHHGQIQRLPVPDRFAEANGWEVRGPSPQFR